MSAVVSASQSTLEMAGAAGMSGSDIRAIAARSPLPAAAEYDGETELLEAAEIARSLRASLVAGPPFPGHTVELARAMTVLILRRRASGLPRAETCDDILDRGGLLGYLEEVVAINQKGWPGVTSSDVPAKTLLSFFRPIQALWFTANVGIGKGMLNVALFAYRPPPDWVVQHIVPGWQEAVLSSDNALDFVVMGGLVFVGISKFSGPQFRQAFLNGKFPSKLCTKARQFVPDIGRASAEWGTDAVDPDQICVWTIGVMYQIFTVVQTVSDSDAAASNGGQALFKEVCTEFIDCGVIDILVAAALSFPLQNDATLVSPAISGAITVLQLAAVSEGCATSLLQYIASRGVAAQDIHGTLMDAVRRGAEAPQYFGMGSLDLRAAMAVGVMFGREEDEPGANTVPREVAQKMVSILLDSVNGVSVASPVNAAQVLLAMSASDANTENLLACGVLDALQLVLMQGEECMAERDPWFRYNISAARQACASILLNLSLSQHTRMDVASHAGIASGLHNALSDEQHLTHKSRKLLKDCLFQVQLAAEGTREQPAKATRHRHTMISYAWAQQDVVLRLVGALRKRGYSIWIDGAQATMCAWRAVITLYDTTCVA